MPCSTDTMSSFDALPTEVLRNILSFMDISSLMTISSTQRPQDDNISSLASDNTTWYSLVQRRFGIGCSSRKRQQNKEGVVLVRRYSSFSSVDSNLSSTRKKRPMSYGGSTWKEAYRSLSSTMRIPETSTTSSTVFASSSRFRFQRSANRTAYSSRGKKEYLGVWCLLNHAENCRTKTVGRRTANSFVYHPDRRYLEVKLCLQNTKSGYGCIAIPDIQRIRFVTVDEEECLASCGCDNNSCDNCAPSFPIVDRGPWAPKISLRRRFSEENDGKETDGKCLVLHPFELVVLSIHISCPSDMVNETDVLSTLSSIRVPAVLHTGYHFHQSKASNHPSVATAHFLPEDLLWEYYSQLPGGYISLIDRSRLIPF